MWRLQEVLDAHERPLEPWFKDDLIAFMPNLRAFALSLTGDVDRADDLGQELRAALERLSLEHREVLLLVGAEGVSYEDAALICGCAVGTIKSRVNRARRRLAALLGYKHEDFAGDSIMQAVLNDEG